MVEWRRNALDTNTKGRAAHVGREFAGVPGGTKSNPWVPLRNVGQGLRKTLAVISSARYRARLLYRLSAGGGLSK